MISYYFRVLYQLIGGVVRPPVIDKARKCFEVSFRCYPIDVDMYLHMNNAVYFRVAELARWRSSYITGLLHLYTSEGILFIVAHQSATYLRPILPFQRYVVSSSLTDFDEKWIHMRFYFSEHPSVVKLGRAPVQYAIIDVKAVLKEKSGKTLNPRVLLEYNRPWFDAVMSAESSHQSQRSD
jgi:acyl-CoA thioesterase FadM